MRSLKIGVEELILFIIIILNVLDAFEVITPELDYIKKIISWAALGYLLFLTRPSEIFVGSRDKFLDASMIIGYVFLIIKNLISYATTEITTTSAFLRPLYNALVKNSAIIEISGIYAGIIILAAVALHLANKSLKKPSIISMFHKNLGKPTNLKEMFSRWILLFLTILAFFIVFVNLTMEWLAIAIDAPLVMIGLATYIFFVVRHRQKFNKDSFLARFGDFGSNLYNDIITHIKYKKTVFRAISVMIVLHVITDAFIFLWPYFFGFIDRLYLGLLTTHHPTIFTLLAKDLGSTSITNSFFILTAYLGNAVALLFFLLFPIYLWFLLYKNRKVFFTKTASAVLFSSIFLFIFAPAFKITWLKNESIYGVDIIGQSITSNAIFPVTYVVMASLFLGIIIAYFAAKVNTEKKLTSTLIIASQAFLSAYIILYFISINTYYVQTISFLFTSQKWVLFALFLILFVITAVFYIVGLLSFLLDTHKHVKKHFIYKR